MFNNNEKLFVMMLEKTKRYAKGELELNLCGGTWKAMDYREDLGGSFPIEMGKFSDEIITELQAEKDGIDVRRCCDVCGIAYVG